MDKNISRKRQQHFTSHLRALCANNSGQLEISNCYGTVTDTVTYSHVDGLFGSLSSKYSNLVSNADEHCDESAACASEDCSDIIGKNISLYHICMWLEDVTSVTAKNISTVLPRVTRRENRPKFWARSTKSVHVAQYFKTKVIFLVAKSTQKNHDWLRWSYLNKAFFEKIYSI